MTLSIDELFQEAPSGLDGDTPEQGSWLDTLLRNAATVGLSTTAWQAGAMVRSILMLVAKTLSVSDRALTVMIKGGFLDPAAEITPDPASPSTWTSSEWTPGWLDKLADGLYDVQRFLAIRARGPLNIGNTTGTTYGPFSPGTYHVSAGSKGYSNVDTLSIPPGGVTGATFTADLAGAVGTAAPGTITQPVTALIGVSVTNPITFTGFDPESNAALVQRCRLKLTSLSPDGPKGAYEYFALTAAQLLYAEDPTKLVISPVTRAKVILDTTTGTVRLIVANAAGRVPGIANLPISAVLFAGGGIDVLTAIAHGLSDGNTVTISGVLGAIEANGTWTITVINPTKIHLTGSTPPSSYISGGIVEGGDLGEVDRVIQENAVPDAVEETTETAGEVTLDVTYDVWVPASRAPNFAANISGPALAKYVSGLPIGGLSDPAGAYTSIVPFDGIESAIEGSASYVKRVVVTVNGATLDVSIPETSVAKLGTVTATVHGL